MKDLSIEMMRCIACVFVVGVHMFVTQQFADEYVFPRVFGSCIFADGVSIFWMITGFFMFGNRSYTKMLKKTVTKIIVPMALLSLLAFFLFNWYAGYTSLEESIVNAPEQAEHVIDSVFEWHNGVNGTDHLWFLYTYVLLALAFPLLNPFANTVKGKRQYYLLGAIFAVFFFNDLTENRLFEFSTRGINALVPAALQVLWGYVLYMNRDKFRGNKRIGVLALLGFILINALRTWILMYNFDIGNANHFLFWHSAYALLTSSCVIIACFAFVPKEAKGKLGKFVLEAGACTFMIYVIHMVIRDIIVIKYENPLFEILHAGDSQTYGLDVFSLDVLYMAASIAFVFLLSLVIVWVGKKLLTLAKNVYYTRQLT